MTTLSSPDVCGFYLPCVLSACRVSVQLDWINAGLAYVSAQCPPQQPIDHLRFNSISLRLSLRQKHLRHLADMKAYYENELAELREKLTSAETVSRHSSFIKMEAENERMRQRCRVLEEELLRANRCVHSCVIDLLLTH